MTTTVIIKCPAHNHHRIRIGVMDRTPRRINDNDVGAATLAESRSVFLSPGEDDCFLVYASRTLSVEEEA